MILQKQPNNSWHSFNYETVELHIRWVAFEYRFVGDVVGDGCEVLMMSAAGILQTHR
jgi:hypothetical protein